MEFPKKIDLKLDFSDCVRRLILGWLCAAAVEYLLLSESLRALGGVSGLEQMSMGRVLGITAALFVILTALGRRWDTALAERWGILGAFWAMYLSAVTVNDSPAFGLACGGILVALMVYVLLHTKKALPGIKNEKWLCMVATGAMTVLFFLFVSNWGVSKVRSFSTSSYDFGIFAQMFYSMRTKLLPLTTLERDGLLSHFAVHVSPIYYLMLPFYCLVPEPETLQVLQAAVLASAVIPLWLLGREHGLSHVQRMLLCAVLLVYPAYSGGTSYDLHENCFLTPLLLWLFYGLDRKSWKLTAVAAVLTLTVKEDAAVYVAVAALWLLIRALRAEGTERRWNLITGGAMLAGALVWFFAVTGYLSRVGEGVMTYRYDNFMFDGSDSLFSVIKAAILNPMKLLYECVDEEKLKYITYTILPLAGLPLFTRKYERYLLLIPYVLVNLMSDYSYQHDILFQYNFGSAAFLFYLALLNLSDWTGEWKRVTALVAALIIGACCLGKEVIPTAISYPGYCEEYADYYDSLRTALEAVPDDASVAATTYLTTELSERDVLYDVRYAAQENVLSAEYVVLKVSDTGSYSLYQTEEGNGYDNLVALLLENGYTMHEELTGILEIYRKAG